MAPKGKEGLSAGSVPGRPLYPVTQERRGTIAIAPENAVDNKASRPVAPRPQGPRIVETIVEINSNVEQNDQARNSEVVVNDNSEDLGGSDSLQPDGPDEQQLSPNGFGEVNKSTSGTEFYGPTATLAFLLELRSRARSFQSQFNRPNLRPTRSSFGSNGSRKLSIVNFFHSADNDVSETLPSIDESPGSSNSLHQGPAVASPASSVASQYPAPNIEVEKECIQLFFANLHLIYYFLDKIPFLESCERLIWSPDPHASKARESQNLSKFSALYNAVVAVGAITAGDDAVSAPKVQSFLEARSKQRSERSTNKKAPYPPLELAQIYFAKAKTLLGDLFEVCSLESTQTLFLMSIFCQYALKPHGCYMYSGMATRTASAIGIANEPDLSRNPIGAIRTWWCMYYHEMEVCCSLGRETVLREPPYYSVFMGKFPDPLPSQYATTTDKNVFFARAQTELAYILKRTSEGIYHSPSAISQLDKSVAALNLDRDLLHWKTQLAPIFDLDDTPLTEPESVTKRKIVLKLRFYSARILIHRPFLVAAAYSGSSSQFVANIQHCLDASRETIHLLYDTFMNRPFFRTWWYNTTYAFNAITTILYVLVSHLQKGSSDELLKVVEKSLKIFQAMDGIAVARRCAELTQEIFDVAKISVQAQQQQSQAPNITETGDGITQREALPASAAQPVSGPRNDGDLWGDVDTSNLQNDFFASLVNPDILDNFGTNLANMDMDFVSFENINFFRDFGT